MVPIPVQCAWTVQGSIELKQPTPMKNKLTFYGLGILLIVVSGLWLKGCKKDTIIPVSFTSPLSEETLSQIAVQDHHIAIRTHTDTKAAYVPDAGQAVATINKFGYVDLNVQNHGLTFRPIMGTLLSDKLRLAAGFQIGYWNRFELYVGGGFPSPTAFAGLGYRLDQVKWLQNTSVAVIYTSSKELGAAVLLRF